MRHNELARPTTAKKHTSPTVSINLPTVPMAKVTGQLKAKARRGGG